MKYFLLFFLALLSTGCQLFQGQQQAGERVAAEAKQEEVFVPVEKELYVIKEGTIRDEDFKIKGEVYSFSFGEKIKIVAEGKEFYRTERGDYIEKNNVGNWETLKASITNEMLTRNTDINGKPNDSIAKYLAITQISYEEYQEALKHKVDFLIEDTLSIVKNNGKLTFPCQHKTIYLKDQPDDFENPFSTTYAYVGNMPALNQYLVFEDSEDFCAYIFIDKTTGKQTEFQRFPFLSTDKKYIITVGRAYEDLVGIISLYRIESVKPFKINLLVDESTRWWAAYDYFDKQPIFFSKNGYLYASMNVVANFYDEKDELNPQRMYIKVKIK